MFDSRIVLVHRAVYDYPPAESDYRPHIPYPEYLFGNELSPKANEVYDMVREGFHMMGLDNEHYGTREWNPLGNRTAILMRCSKAVV